ncbi:DMT family transporter [Dongia sp.]|uniref:DMT family transporter n=1 Tax=Dongia sp. TaxID=1977262 RepID=UPI0035B312D7
MSTSDTTPMTQPVASPSLRGILCLVGGATVFSLQDVVIKMMSGGYPLSQVLTLRCVIAFVPLYFLLRFGGGGLRALNSQRLPLLLVRAALLLVAYTTYYLAMATLPLAVVVALFFAAPLFIVVLAQPYLGERVNGTQVLAVSVGFVGVIVICRPGGDLLDPAAFLAILSALVYGMAALLARKMGDTESGAVMAIYQNVIFLAGAMVIAMITNAGTDLSIAVEHRSLTFLLRPWVMPGLTDFLLIASTGLVGACGSFLLTQAYRLAEANVVAPFEYASIPIATMFGWAIWNEVPDRYTLIGIALIIGAGLYVLRSKRKTA